MHGNSGTDLLGRSLQDVAAAEKRYEIELKNIARLTSPGPIQALLLAHAEQTRSQHARLNVRLKELGLSQSTLVGLFSQIFNLTRVLQRFSERAARNGSHGLVIAYSMEHAEIAMYEQVASLAALAGDVYTEQLIRTIQQEEKIAAEMMWSLLAQSSEAAFDESTAA